jgi:hypothetical protein
MPAWVIPQVAGTDPQRLAHWFPNHTLAAPLGSAEKTNCNLHAEQLLLGTPTQQTAQPADNGRLCYQCALRPRGV